MLLLFILLALAAFTGHVAKMVTWLISKHDWTNAALDTPSPSGPLHQTVPAGSAPSLSVLAR